VGHEQPADFRRDRQRLARQRRKRRAEAPLGQTVPVQRRGIEEAQTCVIRGVHHRVRFIVRDGLEEIADRRASEPEPRHEESTDSAACWMLATAAAGESSPRNASWIAPQPASSTSGKRTSGGYVIIPCSIVSRVIASRASSVASTGSTAA